MRMLPKTAILLALILCAGCAKPSDAVSVARRDHVLAGPHGWIDITLHAPVTAPAASSSQANGAKTPASAARLSRECGMLFAVDGENEPYAPMSLDRLHDQEVTLQNGAESTEGTLFKLTRLARLSLLLNVILVVAAIVFAIRRRRP
jgi:hypothetical protein